MPEIVRKFKIEYSDNKHTNFFFELLNSLKNNKIPKFNEEHNYLSQLLSDKKYEKLVMSLELTWSNEEESPEIWDLNKNHKEIMFELCGTYSSDEETDEIINIITWASIELGIEKYFMFKSWSNVNGYKFIWLEDNKLLEYEKLDDFKITDFEAGDDYIFTLIVDKYRKGEIKPTEVENRKLSDVEFVYENYSYEKYKLDFVQFFRDESKRKRG